MGAFFLTEEKEKEKSFKLVLQPPAVSVVTRLADTKRGGSGRLAWIFEGKLNIVSQRSDQMSSLPPSASFLSSGPSGRVGNRREC